MFKEFREFIARGNVVDLAVAVVLGAAFGAVVTSFVADVLTPALLSPVLERTGVGQIAELSWNGIAYGRFLASVLSFLAIAASVFLLVKGYNTFTRARTEPAIVEAPPPTREELLLAEIRDLLARGEVTRAA